MIFVQVKSIELLIAMLIAFGVSPHQINAITPTPNQALANLCNGLLINARVYDMPSAQTLCVNVTQQSARALAQLLLAAAADEAGEDATDAYQSVTTIIQENPPQFPKEDCGNIIAIVTYFFNGDSVSNQCTLKLISKGTILARAFELAKEKGYTIHWYNLDFLDRDFFVEFALRNAALRRALWEDPKIGNFIYQAITEWAGAEMPVILEGVQRLP